LTREYYYRVFLKKGDRQNEKKIIDINKKLRSRAWFHNVNVLVALFILLFNAPVLSLEIAAIDRFLW